MFHGSSVRHPYSLNYLIFKHLPISRRCIMQICGMTYTTAPLCSNSTPKQGACSACLLNWGVHPAVVIRLGMHDNRQPGWMDKPHHEYGFALPHLSHVAPESPRLAGNHPVIRCHNLQLKRPISLPAHSNWRPVCWSIDASPAHFIRALRSLAVVPGRLTLSGCVAVRMRQACLWQLPCRHPSRRSQLPHLQCRS